MIIWLLVICMWFAFTGLGWLALAANGFWAGAVCGALALFVSLLILAKGAS